MSDTELQSILRGILSGFSCKTASVEELGDSLIKAARKEHMSLEQLGRMVNVLNLERTLAHHKSASSDDERGADLNLLDAPALMTRYATELEPQSKSAAATTTVPSQWKSYATGVGDHFRMPSAEQIEKDADKLGGGWQRAKAARVAQADTEVLQALENMSMDSAATLRGIFDTMIKRANLTTISDTSELLSDMTTADPFVAEAFGNHLHASGYRQAKVACVDFSVDPYRLGNLVESARDALNEGILADLMLAEKKAAGGVMSRLGTDDIFTDDDEVEIGKQPTFFSDTGSAEYEDDEWNEGQRTSKGRQQEPENSRGGLSPLLYALTRSTASPVSSPEASPAPGVPNLPPVNDGESHLMAALQAAGQAGNLVGTAGRGVGNAANDLAKLISQPTASTQSKGMADMYSTLLGSGLLNKNKRVNEDVLRLQQQITLTRLLKTDDIVSKAKRGEAVALFNSIRNANPAVAADFNIVKLLMREALTHQGLPLQAVKTLTDSKSAKP